MINNWILACASMTVEVGVFIQAGSMARRWRCTEIQEPIRPSRIPEKMSKKASLIVRPINLKLLV